VTTATWPTTAELETASEMLAKASHAIDELHLRYFKLDEEMAGKGDRAPSLETLGALSCFLVYADMDLEAIQSHLKTTRQAFRSGVIERGDLKGGESDAS
jgi:hypothetical protein